MPTERVEWFLTFAPDYPHGRSSGWDDGVILDVEPVVQELDRDEFLYVGRTLHLEWLTGAEGDTAWHEYGWQDEG